MMLKKLKKRVHACSVIIPHYLQLQLFLMLMSWPILLTQGIPLSAGAIIGNLLFTPLLTLYLTLASLIFFLELCTVPADPCVFLLELLTQLWCWLLDFSHSSWLCYFPRPSVLMLMLIPAITLSIMHLKKMTPSKGIIALTLLFVGTGIVLKTGYLNQEDRWTIPCFGKELLVLQDEKLAALIDESGALGRRVSAPSFTALTLIPTLIKQGIPALTFVILPNVSLTLFKAAAALIAQFPIHTLYIPAWQSSSFKNRGWVSWEELLRTAQQSGTTIVFVEKSVSVTLGTKTITLTPHEKSVTKNGLTYTPFTISLPHF